MKPHARRRLLLPLVPIYAAVMGVKRWLYDRGVLSAKRLSHPVISVGSLSAGGAGKTPVVLLLAELLERQGFEVRVLTRGYGRTGKEIEKVDIAGDAMAGDRARFGDEPLLLARRLPTSSVYVGANRYRAGIFAQRSDLAGTKAIYLLDDGFQHWKLARDIDAVLLTQKDVEDRLLPAGDLREPLGALRRADVVMVREEETAVREVAQAETARSPRLVWVIRRRLHFPEATALPTRPVVFCALARPEGFLKMLGDAGVTPVAVFEFRDHYPYTDKDIDRLIELATQHNANGFLTTEKDAVKLSAPMVERMEAVGRVTVPRLQVELVDGPKAIAELMALLHARLRPVA